MAAALAMSQALGAPGAVAALLLGHYQSGRRAGQAQRREANADHDPG